ncbi:MAG TPA: amidohydrolase family protein [Chloroflexota bacterium]|jgi:predicted TIM-barrel fold metal-dependent hydrolase|nr:amidohydrolase family protein [Chloroflexota bacterium]
MAVALQGSKSWQIHRQLDHPVVDGDAHWLESVPIFHDYLKATAGQAMLDDYIKTQDGADRWFQTAPEERFRRRMGRPNYWFGPGNTLDRATSMIPKLMYERLQDFGLDYCVVYPTLALGSFQGVNRAVAGAGSGSDLRRACVRAYNVMAADMFKPYSDRITPAFVMPMITPQEAIEEAEYCVKTLGLKVAKLDGVVQRPIPADEEWQPDPAKRRHYFDNLALDSLYDYDPLWAKMVELGLAYTSHSGSSGDTATRTSPSSVVQSRVGHFAQAHQIAVKGLLLGGVPYRFPKLNFAFLEAGVAWAVNVCVDMMLLFTKFGREGLERDLHPNNLDPKYLRELFEEYGTDPAFTTDAVGRIFDGNNMWPNQPGKTAQDLIERAADWDEFAKAHISRPEQIRDLFANRFYFGCESDDPTVSWAFNERAAMGTRFKPIFSSDISHFDVTDMTEVLEEAWEPVEHGLIDEQAFREMTFTNTVALHGLMNPNFFKGTAVEGAAERELARIQGK